MGESIAQHREEVQRGFQAVLAWAEGEEPRRFETFEAELWLLMLALGRTLVSLFLAHQAGRIRPREYEHGGLRWRLNGERRSELGTRFGKVIFRRPVGRRPDALRAACDLPVDRELGLCSGFSVGVVMGMARLCAQMAYVGARETFREFFHWAPSPRAVLRMVDAVGERARGFLEQLRAPEEDGEILVIQVDSRGAPMISEAEYGRRCTPHRPAEYPARRARRIRRRLLGSRPRRTKGKKSKNAKMAVVGVVYTLRVTAEGLEGPIAKRLFATFESHEALFIWLRREADKRGYGAKECLFLADGAPHIWRLQQRYFPDAEVCIDWYHVVEYLWTAGECLYPEGSQELHHWIGRQTRALRRGACAQVLAELEQALAGIPRTGPGTKGRRKRLRDTACYFRNQLARMRYAELLDRDLDIGTGAVEGAVRNLVAMRLDGPGMRWGRERAERVLHLRCILINGQWSEFTNYISKQHNFNLAAQPKPATPHAAKAAA